MRIAKARTLWIFDQEQHQNVFTNPWRKSLPQQIKGFVECGQLGGWIVRSLKAKRMSGSDAAPAKETEGSAAIHFRQIAEFKEILRKGKLRRDDRLLFLNPWHPGIGQCAELARKASLRLSIDVMWQSGPTKDWNNGVTIKRTKVRADLERSVFRDADRHYFATYAHWRHQNSGGDFSNFADKVHFVGWPMEYLRDAVPSGSRDTKKDVILLPHNVEPYFQSKIRDILQTKLVNYEVISADARRISKARYRDLIARSAAVVATGHEDVLGVGIFEGLLAGAVPIVPALHSYKEIYGQHCCPEAWTSSMIATQRNSHAMGRFIEDRIRTTSLSELSFLASQIGASHYCGDKLYASLLR